MRNASQVLQFQRGFATALEAASETPVAEDGSVDSRVVAICKCFCEWVSVQRKMEGEKVLLILNDTGGSILCLYSLLYLS